MSEAVNLLGVQIDNPTQVWMQLMNTRRNVLNRASKWNSQGWFEGQAGSSASPFTMCLANALRFVTHAKRDEPTHLADAVEQEAEQLTYAVMNSGSWSVHPRRFYSSIPEFNDETGRRYSEIRAVLDKAIELIKPHAQVHTIVYADDVLTPEESKQLRQETWKVEDEMWLERRAKEGLFMDGQGRWRNREGHFVSVPKWIKRHGAWVHADRDELGTSVPLPNAREAAAFKDWLDDHEQRGWDTFWDELFECDEKDEECKKARAEAEALGAVKPAGKAKPRKHPVQVRV